MYQHPVEKKIDGPHAANIMPAENRDVQKRRSHKTPSLCVLLDQQQKQQKQQQNGTKIEMKAAIKEKVRIDPLSNLQLCLPHKDEFLSHTPLFVIRQH